MYQPQKTEKIYKRHTQYSIKNSQNSPAIPSFSSSLLDEIYKSIDQGNEKALNPKYLKNRVLEKQSNVIANISNRRMREDEIEAMKRASLIETWIQKNNLSQISKPLEKTPTIYHTSSSSSGSNSSFEVPRKIKVTKKSEKPKSGSNHEEGEFYFLENYHKFRSPKNNQGGVANDENLIKSKSRAYKIYNNLKKIKQPISPGGRLTSFLNSLFTNGVSKKTKVPSPTISTCSSASSYTRSCMSKNSSKTNKSSNGDKRSVSFHPMSVIIGEDNRACGQKYSYNGDYKENEILGKSKYAKFDDQNDDTASDSSSDLFELDNLSFVGNSRRCSEELPVYKTTRLHTNVAIANGFIR